MTEFQHGDKAYRKVYVNAPDGSGSAFTTCEVQVEVLGRNGQSSYLVRDPSMDAGTCCSVWESELRSVGYLPVAVHEERARVLGLINAALVGVEHQNADDAVALARAEVGRPSRGRLSTNGL